MRGFLDIDGGVYPMAIYPGPRLPDGRAIALAEDKLTVGDRSHVVTFLRDGEHLWVRIGGQTHVVQFLDAVSFLASAGDGDSAGDVSRAPMPGVVVSLAVALGDVVAAGDTLLVIESMKLETTMTAGISGTVKAIHFAVGESFDRDAILAEIEGNPDAAI